ncbi:hypothetical protein CYMTET_34774 [Cymbomonas tetramitiformis]|uniref:Calx-beta domain-containing protein n=1 Tax=Cymbomonas tetramitiformis TaxID=36881 RepID=A0AAE0FB02_9CHLO|nr:hypothetical protein CYMTET_34774 [Cymbomonas tetramitiformis]
MLRPRPASFLRGSALVGLERATRCVLRLVIMGVFQACRRCGGAVTLNKGMRQYWTQAGVDYEGVEEGELLFDEGSYSKVIRVPVYDSPGYQGDRKFTVRLFHVDGGDLATDSLSASIHILETSRTPADVLLHTPVFQAVVFLSTVFALFGLDILFLVTDVQWDLTISILTVSAIMVMMLESGLLVYTLQSKYLLNTMFLLDVAAIWGLILYIPHLPFLSFIKRSNSAVATSARMGRAARAASRVGKHCRRTLQA